MPRINGTLANNARLREIMKTHDLSRRAVCEMLELPVHRNYSNSTVDGWVADKHPMPNVALRLVEWECGERSHGR